MEKILDGGIIHYWVDGVNTDECIVFLHPPFVDHRCFYEQIEFFKKEYKVITPDLPGHGKSNGRGRLLETAQYINRIMKIEAIESINLVGVSLGAVLAQDFANKYPEKISSLCCISGYDINNFDKSLERDIMNIVDKVSFIDLISIDKFADIIKTKTAHTVEAQEKIRYLVTGFRLTSLMHFDSLLKLVNKYKIEERKYPFLIGVGEYDDFHLVKSSTDWSKREKSAKFNLFKNSGHIVNMDTPDEFNKVVLSIIT